MARPWKLILFVVLMVCTGAQAQEEDDSSIYAPTRAERMLFHSPWFLPREALLGAYIGSRTLVPTLRLKWELSVYHANRDTLFWDVEGALAYGLSLPATSDADFNPPADSLY